MIVMRFGRCFIPGASIAEIVAIKDARFFEQAHSAVDGGDGNARIARRCAFVELFDIRMVGAFREYPRDHAALFGDPETPFCAKRFDIDCLVQGCGPFRLGCP
jgi:hypothetical protein